MQINIKQKKELIGAIYEFLSKNNLNITAQSLKTEFNDFTESNDNSLERKWIAIFRLQNKIFDLEEENNRIKKDWEFATEFKKKGWNNNKSNLGIINSSSKFILKGHKDIINSICFHPVYSALISGSSDGTIKLWDFEIGKLEKTLTGHTYSVNDVIIDKEGKLIASASSDQTIKIWDFQEKVCIKTLVGHDHIVSAIKFNLNEELLSVSRDKTLKLWDINTGYCKKTFNEHENWPRTLDVKNDGSLVATGGHDQLIYIWDLNKKENIGILSGHEHVIESLNFINNSETKDIIENSTFNKKKIKGEFLISTSRDKLIKIWEITNLVCLHTLKGHDEWVKNCKVLYNKKYIVSVAEDNTMKIWNLENGNLVKNYPKVHENFINCIDVHSEFMVIATGSVDKTIKIWEII